MYVGSHVAIELYVHRKNRSKTEQERSKNKARTQHSPHMQSVSLLFANNCPALVSYRAWWLNLIIIAEIFCECVYCLFTFDSVCLPGHICAWHSLSLERPLEIIGFGCLQQASNNNDPENLTIAHLCQFTVWQIPLQCFTNNVWRATHQYASGRQ